MAYQLEVEYKIFRDNDFVTYEFVLDGTTVRFYVTEFSGIDDYNSFVFDEGDKVFNKEENGDINSIVGYEWEIIEKTPPSRTTIGNETPCEKVNIVRLIRMIEFIGKHYVMMNWPDVIFYEDINSKLSTIYSRMFSVFGYSLEHITDNAYFFVRESKDKYKEFTKIGENL